jgi:hypothetical protein
MRLRPVGASTYTIEARTDLLSLPRFGWISTPERAGVWSEIIRLLEAPAESKSKEAPRQIQFVTSKLG